MGNITEQERGLLTSLFKHYEPDKEVTDDYMNNLISKYGPIGGDKLVSSLIKFYEPDADVSEEYLNGIFNKYGVKKKEDGEISSGDSPLSLGFTKSGSESSSESPLIQAERDTEIPEVPKRTYSWTPSEQQPEEDGISFPWEVMPYLAPGAGIALGGQEESAPLQTYATKINNQIDRYSEKYGGTGNGLKGYLDSSKDKWAVSFLDNDNLKELHRLLREKEEESGAEADAMAGAGKEESERLKALGTPDRDNKIQKLRDTLYAANDNRIKILRNFIDTGEAPIKEKGAWSRIQASVLGISSSDAAKLTDDEVRSFQDELKFREGVRGVIFKPQEQQAEFVANTIKEKELDVMDVLMPLKDKIPKDVSPKKLFDIYYAVKYRKWEDLGKNLGIDERSAIDQTLRQSLSSITLGASVPPIEREYYRLGHELKALAPISLLDINPLAMNDESDWKTYRNGLLRGLLPSTQETHASQQQEAIAIQQHMREAGVEADISKAHRELIAAKTDQDFVKGFYEVAAGFTAVTPSLMVAGGITNVASKLAHIPKLVKVIKGAKQVGAPIKNALLNTAEFSLGAAKESLKFGLAFPESGPAAGAGFYTGLKGMQYAGNVLNKRIGFFVNPIIRKALGSGLGITSGVEADHAITGIINTWDEEGQYDAWAVQTGWDNLSEKSKSIAQHIMAGSMFGFFGIKKSDLSRMKTESVELSRELFELSEKETDSVKKKGLADDAIFYKEFSENGDKIINANLATLEGLKQSRKPKTITDAKETKTKEAEVLKPEEPIVEPPKETIVEPSSEKESIIAKEDVEVTPPPKVEKPEMKLPETKELVKTMVKNGDFSYVGQSGKRGKDALFDARLDMKLSSREMEKGLKDIEEGKESVPAKRIIERIDEMIESGDMQFIQGHGGITRKMGVPVDEYFGHKERLSDKDVEVAEDYDYIKTLIDKEGITLENIDKIQLKDVPKEDFAKIQKQLESEPIVKPSSEKQVQVKPVPEVEKPASLEQFNEKIKNLKEGRISVKKADEIRSDIESSFKKDKISSITKDKLLDDIKAAEKGRLEKLEKHKPIKAKKEPSTEEMQALPEKLRAFAEVVRSGKISRIEGFKSGTGFDVVWDGALEVVAKSLETTENVLIAVQKGLDYIKQSDWYKSLGKKRKRNFDKKFISRYKTAYEEETGSKIPTVSYITQKLNSYKQLLKDISKGKNLAPGMRASRETAKELSAKLKKYLSKKENFAALRELAGRSTLSIMKRISDIGDSPIRLERTLEYIDKILTNEKFRQQEKERADIINKAIKLTSEKALAGKQSGKEVALRSLKSRTDSAYRIRKLRDINKQISKKNPVEAQEEINEIMESAENRGEQLTEKELDRIETLEFASVWDMNAPKLSEMLGKIEAIRQEARSKAKAEREERHIIIKKRNTSSLERIIPEGKKVVFGSKKNMINKRTHSLKEEGTIDFVWDSSWTSLMQKLSIFRKGGTRIFHEFLNKTFTTDLINKSEVAEEKGKREMDAEKQQALEGIFGVKGGKLKNKIIDGSVEEVSNVTVLDEKGQLGNLYLSQNTALQKWMEYKSSDLTETFHKPAKEGGMGWTEETVRQLEEYLQPEWKNLGEWMLGKYRAGYDRYNPTYQFEFGIDMGKVLDFVPLTRERGVFADSPIDLLKQQTVQSHVSNRHIKSRQANTNPLAYTGALETFNEYYKSMEAFKNWYTTVRVLNETFKDKDVKEAIAQFHGTEYNKMINWFIDRFAGVDKRHQVRALDIAVRRLGKGILYLKPAIGIKQTISTAMYGADMPVHKLGIEIGKQLSNPKLFKERLDAIMSTEFWKSRGEQGFDLDIAPVEKKHNYRYRKTQLGQKLRNLGIKKDKVLNRLPIEMLDKIGAAAIKYGDLTPIALGGSAYYGHWLGVYKKTMPLEAAKAKALKDFEIYSNNTQQSTRISNISYLRGSSSYGRAITMFTTGAGQIHRFAAHAYREILHGRNVVNNFKKLVIAHGVMGAAYSLAGNSFKWDDEEMIMSIALGNLRGQAFIGQGAGFMKDKIQGKPWAESFKASPVLDNLITIASSGVELSMELASVNPNNIDALEHGQKLATAVASGLGVPITGGVKIYTGTANVIRGESENPIRESLGIYNKYSKGVEIWDVFKPRPTHHVKKNETESEYVKRREKEYGESYTPQEEFKVKKEYKLYKTEDNRMIYFYETDKNNYKKAMYLLDVKEKDGNEKMVDTLRGWGVLTSDFQATYNKLKDNPDMTEKEYYSK